MIATALALMLQVAAIDTAAPVEQLPPQVARTWVRLETDCRGRPSATRDSEACYWRDRLARMMAQAGWCRGPQALPAYMHEWRRCAAVSRR